MVGDQDDLYSRIKRLLPAWFGREEDAPYLAALLQGAAWALSQIYLLYAFAVLQVRVATATGGWLELASNDYFGSDLKRFGGELDASYSRRIRLEVLRDRNTLNALDRAVFDLTGNHPILYEAFRASICGGYGTTALAFGMVGAYGSPYVPYQVLVTTPAPRGYGIPNRPGFGNAAGGFSNVWAFANDADLIANGPTPIDVLNALERVRAAGVTIFVRFADPIPTPGPAGQSLDFSDPYNSGLLPGL